MVAKGVAVKTPDDDHVAWLKFMSAELDKAINALQGQADPLHIVLDRTPQTVDDVAREWLDKCDQLADSIAKARSQMDHPTYRVPQTRDEAMWERELRDAKR